MPRHQAQAAVERLIKVGHSVVSDYSTLGLQLRHDGIIEEQCRLSTLTVRIAR